ncbi:MAG: transglycosylase SLT domain-containing protein [Pseudomonadota bacterium]
MKLSSKSLRRSIVTVAAILVASLATAALTSSTNVSPSSANPALSLDQDEVFLALRDAARRDDSAKAGDFANRLSNYAIPSYVDYYRLKSRLAQASITEINDFLNRYSGSAIADRLRNDWLLEAGHRRNWVSFDEHYPQFVLNDDLQVKCFALMSRAIKGQNVADDARALLVTPKDYGDACHALISTLANARQFKTDDLWNQTRLAAETNAVPAARRLADLLDVPESQIAHAIEFPSLTLARGVKPGRAAHEAFFIALGRSARSGHAQAAHALRANLKKLDAKEQALAWSQIALQASLDLAPDAIDYWRLAQNAPLSPEGVQWKARIGLRYADWKLVKSAVEAMPLALRESPAWIYWLGRALQAEGKTEQAQKLWSSILDQSNFYGQLALEELGHQITIPQAGLVLSSAEIAPMASNPGFQRAFKFFSMNLRFEGTREWNWELRKMSEREMIAAAEFARQKNVLDRMVHTSDRTRKEFDFTQRFPSPFRDSMVSATQKVGIDMAWVYGLIRQESRFIMNARSHVGASGLMQLMPGTAKYVAKKIGMTDFAPHQVNDIDVNIALGTNYLNMVLGNLDGSQALATAAYNAGPGRPKAWRATLPATVEGAIFAESIPFAETRGYVKNVLSNATYYAALFENKPQSLKARLGVVAPRSVTPTDLP